jgi:hypothetical protein
MKDLVHHMKHVQRKVLASSRKTEIANNENKVNGSKDSTKVPLNEKKKIYGSLP